MTSANDIPNMDEIDPDAFNLAEYVLSAGRATPDKIALAVLGPSRSERWSYQKLTDGVARIAAGLRDAGARPGHRILLRIGNEPSFPMVYLAAAAIGALPVPTSAQLTRTEITAMSAELDPQFVVMGDGIALPDHPAPVLSAADLMAQAADDALSFERGAASRPGYIVFTSGTSGRSRGVVHAHRAVLARRSMFDGWYGLSSEDRVLHAGAFNWTYTLGTGLLDPWTMGATALIPADGVSSGALPLLMGRHDVSIFAAAPGVYRQILRQDLPRLPKLRHGLSAGEKLPEAIRADWQAQTGRPIFEAYGMSECSTFISGAPDRPAPNGALGFAQPGRRISIRAAGAEATTGQPGTIAVHSSDPGLMLGYLGDPDEANARMDGDWFLTGDTGVIEPSGAVRYLGRDDDMMNAGGYRVSPIEVEQALTGLPGVDEVAVCELRVKADASVIAAFVVGTATEDEITEHAARHLARYKRPRLIAHCDALPRGANGKLLRKQLRQTWESQNGHA